MAHHDECNPLDEVLQILANHGFDGLAQGIEILMNEAMKLQRNEACGTTNVPHPDSRWICQATV